MEVVLSRFDIVLLVKEIMSIIHSFVFLIYLFLDCGERWVAIFLVVVFSTERIRLALSSLSAICCSPTCTNVGSVVFILISTT